MSSHTDGSDTSSLPASSTNSAHTDLYSAFETATKPIFKKIEDVLNATTESLAASDPAQRLTRNQIDQYRTALEADRELFDKLTGDLKKLGKLPGDVWSNCMGFAFKFNGGQPLARCSLNECMKQIAQSEGEEWNEADTEDQPHPIGYWVNNDRSV